MDTWHTLTLQIAAEWSLLVGLMFLLHASGL